MKDWKYLKIKYIIPIVYLLIITLCIIFVFGNKDYNVPVWWKILTLLTVPWSVLIGLLAMFLLHNEITNIIAIMYLVFAGINAFLLYLGFKRKEIQ